MLRKQLSEMKNSAEVEGRELTLTLLSPLKMATIRTVTIIGTMDVGTAINRILEPLINDGFTIKEINIVDGQITIAVILHLGRFISIHLMNCSAGRIFQYAIFNGYAI